MMFCYECPSRYPTCHSKCKEYIDSKKVLDDRKAKIDAEKNKYKDADAFTSTIINKQRRKPKL